MDEPACEFDGPWKEALEWYFDPFLAFFFPDAHAGIDWGRGHEFVDKELQTLTDQDETGKGTVDKLVKVWHRDGVEVWAFVHVEVQSQHDTDFGQRMYTYNHRLDDRYGRMPVSLAILGDDGTKWRPTGHSVGLWGCSVQFTFPVAKLLDYKDQEAALETDPNPFAAVVLAHLKTLETRGDITGRQGWKLRLVKGLYSRGLGREQVVKLYRLIDWMMALPPVPQATFETDILQFEEREKMPFMSPSEQNWLNRGINQGLEKGRTEGRTEGIVEGLTRGIALGVRMRFGTASAGFMPRVQSIKDPVILTTVLEAIETAPTVDALSALLPPEG